MADRSARKTLDSMEAGSPCLQGEIVVFTGTLASMPHRQAHELVEQHGGVAAAHVSRHTTMLVIGEEGWPLDEQGQPSQKLQQVVEWRQQGHDARIVNESEWLHLLGVDERRQEVHRLYTPSMLSKLLDVPVHVIRGWERAGLIKPVRKVFRLPYFDFQEVTSARRLAQLLAAKVPRREIEASLTKLQSIMEGIDQPLAQLEILARGSRVVYRDRIGLVEPASGQRVFDFDAPDHSENSAEKFEAVPLRQQQEQQEQQESQKQWTGDDWFLQGCGLLEENNAEAAVEAFRLCLMERPGDAEANFHLADALYRSGNLNGALERYHVAVEADHSYLEAWTQLGSVYDELGEVESALQAFDIALKLHPDYPDAHLHKAEVLHRLGKIAQAVPHWQKYLEYDSRGPWAENARQMLHEAGFGDESENWSDTDSH